MENHLKCRVLMAPKAEGTENLRARVTKGDTPDSQKLRGNPECSEKGGKNSRRAESSERDKPRDLNQSNLQSTMGAGPIRNTMHGPPSQEYCMRDD